MYYYKYITIIISLSIDNSLVLFSCLANVVASARNTRNLIVGSCFILFFYFHDNRAFLTILYVEQVFFAVIIRITVGRYAVQ